MTKQIIDNAGDFMQLDKDTIEQIVTLVVQNTIQVLEDKNLLGNTGSANSKVSKQSANEKTAYQKTEQLLYNYNGFRRIVKEREEEILELRKYGVPQRAVTIGERVQSSHSNEGIVLDEERVEAAVRNVQASVQGTVQALALIDRNLDAMKNDPYFGILPMRYFEGRTQEDIALEYNCAQSTISQNRSRLIKELALRLFPDQVAREMLN